MISPKPKIPPPVVALALALLMWLVARATPSLQFYIPAHRICAASAAALGALTAIVGILSFRRARTTINPLAPERATALVTTGIYRRTRNPMYLGILLALFGWAVFLSNCTAFLFLPAFVLYMNQFQIRPEEAALASLFGSEYVVYQSNVRRWL